MCGGRVEKFYWCYSLYMQESKEKTLPYFYQMADSDTLDGHSS